MNLVATVRLTKLQQFLKSTSFSRALLVGIAITLPIGVGIHFNCLDIALALSFGAFWSSPSDVSGNFRHKQIGILFSAVLVTVVSFVGGYLHYETWLSLPVLGVLSFGIAYLSVYGFRASLVSFSGLLALVLSFAQISSELEVYQNALLTGAGGIWYLLLAKLWNKLKPKAETEELLYETYLITAQFIDTRGKLLGAIDNRQPLINKLFELQGELTEKHATLREILVLSRTSSGWSSYHDKRLLIFVQLVEVLETAIANPVNYSRMNALLEKHPACTEVFQRLIFKMAEQLRFIAMADGTNKQLPSNKPLEECITDAQLKIDALKSQLAYPEYLMLQNLLAYQKKQFEKLKRIRWLLGNAGAVEVRDLDPKTAKRFVPPQDYDPKLLVRNFSFKSNIFRHSLRLAVVIMIGYTLGVLFPFQNPYWILLSVVVIMRPNYGLTKSRAKDRTIGTLIGGAIAYAMVFVIQDVYVYGALGVFSLISAIALIQKNAKAAAIFVTLSVVFIYAILSPDVLSVVKFRIIDTLVGAALAYVAMLWLWPTWGALEIKKSIEQSVKANKEFLREIVAYYQSNKAVPASYNIARKEAFLESSNLHAAFQRITQEPKTKQQNVDLIYELVVLSHTFLVSIASISTYVQHHKTSNPPKYFKELTQKIEHNFNQVLQCLEEPECQVDATGITQASTDMQLPQPEKNEVTSDIEHQAVQEIHLVQEQLQWLISISNKMLKLATVLKRQQNYDG